MKFFESWEPQAPKQEEETPAVNEEMVPEPETEPAQAAEQPAETGLDAPVETPRADWTVRIDKKTHQRFISRVTKFIDRNADNPNLHSEAAEKVVNGMGLKPDDPAYLKLLQEARLLLGVKGRDTRDRHREIEKFRRETDLSRQEERRDKYERREGGPENYSDTVARNEGDIRWIDEIKDYVRENRDDPETLARFWNGFDEICRSRKGREVTQFEFGDLKRTKGGVLCELAAEELFLGWQRYLADRKTDGEDAGEGFASTAFRIRKATAEEDATLKTDFFAVFEYDGETVEVPVQVKSAYSEKGWTNDRGFAESNICSAYGPVKSQLGNRLDEQRFRFFRTNPLGFFVILPHGYDDLKIGEDGRPSAEMQFLFYKKLEQQLVFLKHRIDNIKAYQKKNGAHARPVR